VDFEFTARTGERPHPLCVVARELRSGELVRCWLADGAPAAPPYDIGTGNLLVAFYSSAEWGCHLALGWPMPARILDLYAEFRCLNSGLSVPCGYRLLGVLVYYGLDGIAAAEKDSMRQLAMRGGPYSDAERLALLDYCQTDVDALARLLPAMFPRIDLPRALLRGRYMAAAARMEWNGVPLDVDTLTRLRDGWDRIKGRLIEEVDHDYGVFVPPGQRVINPDSRLGAALVQTADEWGVEVHRLADAVDHLWQRERDATKEVADAITKARKVTGLTVLRIGRWEESGRDYASFPGLDVSARSLARELPALGIGEGYTSESGYDDTDYPGRLWELLREERRFVRPKHDPDLLREAAELVASCPGDSGNYFRPMRFSAERWAAYLCRRGIPWPRLQSGALALDDDTFREMARVYPAEVAPIRELRNALSQMRLQELAVGADGRNRCMLSAFASKTGRNQPSNTRFVFGPSTWLRALIRPEPGRALGYVDWSAQELGIAAALSGDPAMQEAYLSGDPYLWLARRVGAVPADATKKTHPGEREQFKVVSLGVLYGLSADGLARRLNVPPCRGRELLRFHQETFRRFWHWSELVEMQGMLAGQLRTVFGWTVHVGRDANPRSLRNFPMQGNGAEMLRLACCLATERGITVCCPVHDALLVEGPADGIETVVAQTQQVMQEASELVLPGFPLRTDAKIVRHPDRYLDPRGERLWTTVQTLLAALESEPEAEAEITRGNDLSGRTDPHQNGESTLTKMGGDPRQNGGPRPLFNSFFAFHPSS
jgi:hypothetical protein